MNRSRLENYLISSHKQLMNLVDLDNPSVDLRATVENISGKCVTFSIISTSAKVRVEKMVEEKIFMKTKKGEIEGTVIDAYSSTITVNFNSKVKEKDGSVVVLKTHSNYNNEVILKAAENFFAGEKVINNAIYDYFCESALSDHKIVNKDDFLNTTDNNNYEQKNKSDHLKQDSDIKNISEDCNKRLESEDESMNEKTKPTNDIDLDEERNSDQAFVDCEARNLKNTSNIKLDRFAAAFMTETKSSEIKSNPINILSCLTSYVNENKPEFFNKHLNQSQKLCVSLSNLDQPFKILGPPGTGKTETVVEIISQALLSKKSVLVCGPSNISIDNIISRFMQSSYYLENITKFYRLGSAFKGLVNFNIEKMASDAVSFMEKEDDDPNFIKELIQRKQDFTKEFKKDCKLVFSTLFSSLKENHFFDLCIVDEACQGTLLESFIAVTKAKNFILVGDPNQLCPTSSSLYEHLDLPTAILNEQYRMPKDLIEFSNGYFYGSQIKSEKIEDFFFTNQSRILFIDTSYFSYVEEDVDQSKQNYKEALLVQSAIEWLKKQGFTDIGVITPYSAQVRLLRDLTNAQVETVDGFQGQEKDFIVLSMVRSNEDSEIGFLRDKKRLNVAITRAKKGLIVIADSSNFTKDKFFRQFFKFLNSNSEVMDPETFYNFVKF